MSRSYIYNSSSKAVAGTLNLIAVPRWLELSLKSKNTTLEQALGGDPNGGFCCYALDGLTPGIVSRDEVTLHDRVSYSLSSWLFPDNKERPKRDQLYAELINDWHAVPMVKDLKLNLHPIILGENLIGLYNVEEKPGVTDTDLYGRILRCAHTLVYNKLGLGALGCDLIKDVLNEISIGQTMAAQ
jgi:hypothetical protein